MPKTTAALRTRVDGAPIEGIVSIMQARRASFGPLSQKVIDFFVTEKERVVGMSISEVADGTGASEAAVTKICKQLGARGFQEIKLSLAAEIVQPIQFIHEDLARDDDEERVIEKIFAANIAALRDTMQMMKAPELRRAVDAILKAEMVEIYGIGSAAPIAEDAHYRLMRIGIRSRVNVDSHLQAVSASLATKKTVVLTVSHSGSTHETVTAMKLAKQAGATTIAITNQGKSPIQRYSDIVLATVARETKFRTEAMTSRIAQLSIVDALIAALALRTYDKAIQTIQHTFDVLSVKRF
jgi:DNA-binding MurR/RpiR family transcriptional regulator